MKPPFFNKKCKNRRNFVPSSYARLLNNLFYSSYALRTIAKHVGAQQDEKKDVSPWNRWGLRWENPAKHQQKEKMQLHPTSISYLPTELLQ